jgi:NAD(P)-dependent dehydrogenase (short-subunit alcohol dehydrogenase family)
MAYIGRLNGKTALITGAGSGVGRSCMRLFADEGALVFGVSRTQANLDQTLQLLRDAGNDGTVFSADVATVEGVDATIKNALATFARIDILVHAAGVGYSWQEKHSPGTMADVVNTAPEKWHEVIRIDLDACFLMCRAVIPHMRQHQRGSIVNVASISGFQGLPEAHAYTAAKGGVINLTRSLCVAYASQGIRANCVAPGFVATPMVESFLHLFDDPKVAESITPMARPATSDEIAYGCLYLASDEASYCNGSVLVIDGGQTARQ